MSKLHPRIGDLRSCKVIEVIEIKRGVGKGAEDDPHRIVHEYFALDGKLLARYDTVDDEGEQ